MNPDQLKKLNAFLASWLLKKTNLEIVGISHKKESAEYNTIEVLLQSKYKSNYGLLIDFRPLTTFPDDLVKELVFQENLFAEQENDNIKEKNISPT